MPIRARVVFQGLIAFLRDTPSKTRFNRMAALPVDQGGHAPHHRHLPRLTWRAADTQGVDWAVAPTDIQDRRVEMVWVDAEKKEIARGRLKLDRSFEEYVPHFGWFFDPDRLAPPLVDERFRRFNERPAAPVTSQVILAEGILAAVRPVAAAAAGQQMACHQAVRFRGAPAGSYAALRRPFYIAEACALEMRAPAQAAALRVTITRYPAEPPVTHVLYPMRGFDVDGIELLVQNLPAGHRAKPSAYGVHFKHYFELLTPDSRRWLESETNLGKLTGEERAENAHFPGNFPYPYFEALQEFPGNPKRPAPRRRRQHSPPDWPICPPMGDE